jgi:hypothetical protein
MARLDALSMLQEDGATALKLNEVYNKVIDGFSARAVSMQLKNPEYTGDVDAGSVVAKRFVDSVSKAYGTARTAGAGAFIEAEEVVVPIDTHKEIIEEAEQFDLDKVGLAGIVERRQRNHISAMVREADTAFFAKAYSTGTQVTHTATDWIGKLEEMIVALQSVSNDYVDGIEREMARLVVTPTVMSAVRVALDALPANDNTFTQGALGMFHGVPIWESVHLPKGALQVADAFCMVDGAIAQPIGVTPYSPSRIPLSKAIAIELYFDYGTASLTPDLIFYSGDAYVA